MAEKEISISAAPYKNCNYCSSKVLNGLQCEKCNLFFHPSCAKRVKGAKIIGSKLICCDNQIKTLEPTDCDLTLGESIQNSVNNNERFYLNCIIEQKDIIIKELREKISLLYDKIDLLNQINYNEPKKVEQKTQKTKSTDDKNSSRNTHNEKQNTSKMNDNRNNNKKTTIIENSNISKNKQSSYEELETYTKNKFSEILKLKDYPSTSGIKTSQQSTPDMNTKNGFAEVKQHTRFPTTSTSWLAPTEPEREKGQAVQQRNNIQSEREIIEEEGKWTEVQNRKQNLKRHKKPLFYGTSDDVTIKGLPRRSWYFLSRLKPDMTEQELQEIFVKKCPNSDVVVEKLKLYNDFQSAFKVGIPVEFEEQSKHANFWPKDSRVDKFHFLLQKKKKVLEEK